MDVVALYKRAWAQVSDDLGSWVVLYLVFFLLNLFTGGLAVVLMPNLHRELRDAKAQGRGPEVGKLFDFTHISTDAVAGLVYLAAMYVGSIAAGIGTTVAALALAFIMPLAADNRFEPLDNAKLSAQHAFGNLPAHGVFLVATFALAMLGLLTCGFGFILIGPLIGMATQMFYEDSREELDELARGMGLLADDGGQA